MTIKCAVCPTIAPTLIKSLLIDQKSAIKEISNKLSAHIIQRHPEHTRLMQFNITKVTQMLTWFLLMSQAAMVPEDEKFLIGEVEKVRGELCKLLGVEVIGNEDEVEVKDATDTTDTTEECMDEKPLVET